MNRLPMRRGREGFTLIELLVVIAIIAVLIGLLVPAVQKVREAANRMTCSNNMKQIGIAVHSFNDAFGKLPGAMRCPFGASNPGASPPTSTGYNINVALLPYLEQDALYKMAITPWTGMSAQDPWSWDAPVPGTPSGTLRTKTLKAYNCPSDPTYSSGFPTNQVNGWAGTSYAANYMVFGKGWVVTYIGGNGKPDSNSSFTIATVPDGTSNVVGFGERVVTCNTRDGSATITAGGNLLWWPGGNWWWSAHDWGPTMANGGQGGQGNNWNQPPMVSVSNADKCDRSRPSSSHNTCQVLMLDGSARGVGSSVTQATWQQAITANDGVPLGSDW